ncbi:MAG: apolipoprotein N-acyltransferase [Gammaproteobacteria bacterium]|nr:apolipoprotein N-acyltransferase [Gammaproteobacteria bacterium]
MPRPFSQLRRRLRPLLSGRCGQRLGDAGALGAGALMPAAFAPWNLWPLPLPLLALLALLWRHGTTMRACWRGWLFGFGMFAAGVGWVRISIRMYGDLPGPVAWLLSLILAAILALYPALVGLIGRRLMPARPGCTGHDAIWLLLAVPSLWTLSEWLRSLLLTGFPWLSLGYSQTDGPLGGWAPLLGIFGLGWLLAHSACLLAWLCLRRGRGALPALCLGGLIWALGPPLREVSWTAPRPGGELSVAVIQGAIPQPLKWDAAYLTETVTRYRRLSAPHWGADLIVWPETVIPAFRHQVGPLLAELRQRGQSANTELLLGIPVRDSETGKLYNSLLYLGRGTGVYHKRHLVPFGEYLPLERLLAPPLRRLGVPVPAFSGATGEKPLLYPSFGPVGVAICYEIIFGSELLDMLPEAELLVNVSNDAWFGDSLAPHQHLQIARARALEVGRYLVRATNDGISAVIDEKGRLLAQAAQFQPQTLTARALQFRGITPYARWGDWPMVALSLALCAASLAAGRNARRNERLAQ